MKLPLEKPAPDVERFIRIIRGDEIASRPPLAELFLDHEVERAIAKEYLGLDWVEPSTDRGQMGAYLCNRIACTIGWAMTMYGYRAGWFPARISC